MNSTVFVDNQDLLVINDNDQLIHKIVIDFISNYGIDFPLLLENWDSFQYLSSLKHFDLDKINSKINNNQTIVSVLEDYVTKQSISNMRNISAYPSLSPLHIALSQGNEKMVEFIINNRTVDINEKDSWGFTPLHYAVTKRSIKFTKLLLDSGCSVSSKSNNGCTALDLSKSLKLIDIENILTSRTLIENNPNYIQFNKWLQSLNATEFFINFINAGYDLSIISKNGLNDSDLDCVGIPMNKLGLRKKLIILHDLNKFYKLEEDDDDDDENSEDNSDESSGEGST